jgi:hypothetical protein
VKIPLVLILHLQVKDEGRPGREVKLGFENR